LTNKNQHKKAIVSVINDLITDQRVNRTCLVLKELGYDVLLVGRRKTDSKILEQRSYATKRMNLLFEKGVLFYLEFQLRLIWLLVWKKSDLLVANDLDTLLPNYLFSKIKKSKLIYDSHEIFCEVPELINTPFKKRIWEALEKMIVPRLKNCITVNQSIAKWFENKYQVNFEVVRNIGNLPVSLKLKSREELGIPSNKKMILIQGAGINIDRGAEECVAAMSYLNDVVLYIIGSGDVIELLKNTTIKNGLEHKINFIDKLPANELIHYTACADLGLTLDKDTNLNYRYSLPNKIFDFINAGIPVLSSRLNELEALITNYQIGDFIENHQPIHIANKINEMLFSDKYWLWKENTQKAKSENNWEKESKILINLIEKAS
jgi:glycosyltransferase involved in cell wall biosynthesis